MSIMVILAITISPVKTRIDKSFLDDIGWRRVEKTME